jgi:hypothetical protein
MTAADFLDRNRCLAYALGIPLYVDDAGRVTQHGGPGRREIKPPDGAEPLMLGAPTDFKADPTTA